MLSKIFKMQTELNNRVFKKHYITNYCGENLTSESLSARGKTPYEKNATSDTNIWLGRFLTALEDECRELREELLWKWWSKDSLDMQNIRVEIIDILHFWVSLAMTAGMTAEDVFEIYKQKNEVNFKRQESEYSKANKNEDDNKDIDLEVFQ